MHMVYRQRTFRDIAADHRSLGHVQPWLDAGFSVVDFRRWHDGGFSYEHAVPWLEHQFAPHDAATWRSHRFEAAEAGEWRDVGISPRGCPMARLGSDLRRCSAEKQCGPSTPHLVGPRKVAEPFATRPPRRMLKHSRPRFDRGRL